jgi:hypothetical protein
VTTARREGPVAAARRAFNDYAKTPGAVVGPDGYGIGHIDALCRLHAWGPRDCRWGGIYYPPHRVADYFWKQRARLMRPIRKARTAEHAANCKRRKELERLLHPDMQYARVLKPWVALYNERASGGWHPSVVGVDLRDPMVILQFDDGSVRRFISMGYAAEWVRLATGVETVK